MRKKKPSKPARPQQDADQVVEDWGNWCQRKVGATVHLRDVLIVLWPGNPDAWPHKRRPYPTVKKGEILTPENSSFVPGSDNAYHRRQAAFNEAMNALRDYWKGSFDPDGIELYISGESMKVEGKRLKTTWGPQGGPSAKIDDEIRRLHNEGVTAKIIEAVRINHPDEAQATGLDQCKTAPAPITTANKHEQAEPAKGQQVPYDNTNTNFMAISEAIVNFAEGCIALKKACQIICEGGPVAFMRQGKRCRVHIGQFRAWWATYPKDVDMADKAAEELEKRKTKERARRATPQP